MSQSYGHPSQSQSGREYRDMLRFFYQTLQKGRGKSYHDWYESWKQAMLLSTSVAANALEGF